MKIKQLKELLEQFSDDDRVVVGNYQEEDSEGNMPTYSIQGAEYLKGTDGKVNIELVVLNFETN